MVFVVKKRYGFCSCPDVVGNAQHRQSCNTTNVNRKLDLFLQGIEAALPINRFHSDA